MKKLLVALLVLICLGSLGTNFVLYNRYSTKRPIVRFQDGLITTKDYRDRMDYEAGGPVIRKMLLSRIVLTAANRAKVTPTDKDIDGRIALIQRKSPQALTRANASTQGMVDFRDDLKTDMALENLMIRDTTASDAEIKAFYVKNAKAFTLPAQTSVAAIVTDNPVTAATVESMLARDDFNLNRIAEIPRTIVVGRPGVNFNFNSLPPKFQQRINAAAGARGGPKVKTVKEGSMYVLLRTMADKKAEIPSLATLKTDINRTIRLMKAGRRETFIAKLYREANVVFEQDYSRFFGDIVAASQVDETTQASPKP